MPVTDPMGIRWPETIIQDPVLKLWFEDHLFNDGGYFNSSLFEAEVTLYECVIADSLLEFLVFGDPRPAPFSRSALNDAIKGACDRMDYYPSAWWFHVNVHDGLARVVEKIGTYSFRSPLMPLMILMSYHQAQEGGTTYAGLLDRRKQWCLLLEDSGGFRMSVHGPAAFCTAVEQALGRKAGSQSTLNLDPHPE